MNGDGIKHTVDVAAGSAAVLALMEWLPPIAAFLTIVWYGIRIYEWWKTRKLIKD